MLARSVPPARRSGPARGLVVAAHVAGAAGSLWAPPWAPALAAQVPRPAAAAVAARVDWLVADFQRSTGVPGVSVAVVRAGRDTLVDKGYGVADLENDVPATARTVYRIGSVTKQFTAAAVLQLAEQGRLSLDASLGALLPQVPAAWRAVTVRQLLNHTSGIRDYTEIGPRWVRRYREDMPPDSIVALVRDDTLDFAPGSKWAYSNTGYVLLGMVIEKASGASYAAYLREHFFQPLGLTQTYYCDVAPVIKHRAQGYERQPGGLVNAGYLSMTQPFAAGALCSTVGDLAAWNRALATGRVVGAASWARMTTPEGAAARAHYGYGIESDTLAGHREIAHTGGINGFLSANSYFPDDSLSVTVLTNSGSSPPNRLLDKIARVALGVPLPAAPKVVALSADERARYVGRYAVRGPEGAPIPTRVFVQGDTLTMDATGIGTFPLEPHGANSFGAAEDALQVVFSVRGAGATRIELRSGDRRYAGDRVP